MVKKVVDLRLGEMRKAGEIERGETGCVGVSA